MNTLLAFVAGLGVMYVVVSVWYAALAIRRISVVAWLGRHWPAAWRWLAHGRTAWWTWRHRRLLRVHVTDCVPVDSSDWMSIHDRQRLRQRTPLEALTFRALTPRNANMRKGQPDAVLRLLKITPTED